MTALFQEVQVYAENARCFLCDEVFGHTDQPQLLFENRILENGDIECPMALILSSILGRALEESTAYSKVLCEGCNLLIQEFEAIEQRYIELKFKIIQDYNRTAQIHGEEIVSLEEDGQSLAITLGDSLTSQKVLAVNDAPDSSSMDLFTILSETDNTQNFEGGQESSTQTVTDLEKQTQQPQFFVGNNGENMVEVISEDVHYEQIIEHSVDESNDDDSSVADTLQSGIHTIQSDSSLGFAGVIIKKEAGIEVEEESAHSHIFELQEDSEKCQRNQDEQPAFVCKDDEYYCAVCPKNQEDIMTPFDIKSIANHLRTRHNIRVYICDICGEDFRKRIELSEHVNRDHGDQNEGEYQCETCNRTFANLRMYRLHKRLHYSSSKQYYCLQCNKKYSSKNLLDEHLNMHTGKRPYKCEYCPKDFASKYTLTAHLKIHTDRPRPYSCKECPKAFFSAQNLQQHVKTHSGVKEFICEVCKKAFGTQHNLEVHKVVHTGYKPFICRTCGKAFARRAEIKDHERTHTGEKPFTCDICSMSFAQRSNLTTHKRATHFNDKRYKCELCDRSFKRRRLLDYHVRATHTGERPYKCEMCNATFVYPEHYKKHLRIHSGIKPYACEVCGKKFNSRDNRNAHRFIHSDKKPYECLYCGQGFMRKPLLYQHMQQSGHVNDTIVVNQPRVSDKTDDKVEHSIDESIVDDSDMVEEHLIIDGSVQLASSNADEMLSNAVEVPTDILASELTEVISDDILVTDEGDFIKIEDGGRRMVQITTKDQNGKEQIAWVNLISEKEA